MFGKRRAPQEADPTDEAVPNWAEGGEMGYLQRGIETRVQELHALADYCARKGARLTFWANTTKVVTITLGAVTAARGTLAPLFENWFSAVDVSYLPLKASESYVPIFAVFAIVISVSTGLEAAFRFDRRGVALTALAAEAMSSARQADSDWRKKIGSSDRGDRREVARNLLSELDKKLRESTAAAARQGVSFTHEIYAGRNEYVRDIHRAVAA